MVRSAMSGMTSFGREVGASLEGKAGGRGGGVDVAMGSRRLGAGLGHGVGVEGLRTRGVGFMGSSGRAGFRTGFEAGFGRAEGALVEGGAGATGSGADLGGVDRLGVPRTPEAGGGVLGALTLRAVDPGGTPT